MTLELTPAVIRNIVLAGMIFAFTVTVTSQVMYQVKDALFPPAWMRQLSCDATEPRS